MNALESLDLFMCHAAMEAPKEVKSGAEAARDAIQALIVRAGEAGDITPDRLTNYVVGALAFAHAVIPEAVPEILDRAKAMSQVIRFVLDPRMTQPGTAEIVGELSQILELLGVLRKTKEGKDGNS